MQKPCVRACAFHGSGSRHEQKQKREETMRKLYENLSENYKSLTNESGWVDV